jgi:hypothetical protein
VSVEKEGVIKKGADCGCCGKPVKLSPNVIALIVYAPGMRPYPLIPADDYRICMQSGCESPLRFVKLAIEANPTTRPYLDLWTYVQFDWSDPALRPWQLQNVRHLHQQPALC